MSLNVCRHDLRVDNFDSIYRKYVQHFYLKIDSLKKLDSNIYPMILIVYHNNNNYLIYIVKVVFSKTKTTYI